MHYSLIKILLSTIISNKFTLFIYFLSRLLYYLYMFLDKFKNSKFRNLYSFNFLTLLCLPIYIPLFCIFVYFYYVIIKEGLEEIGFVYGIFSMFCLFVFCIIWVIALIIHIFEKALNFKISNENFLNSHFILIAQALGLFLLIISMIHLTIIFVLILF